MLKNDKIEIISLSLRFASGKVINKRNLKKLKEFIKKQAGCEDVYPHYEEIGKTKKINLHPE